MASLQTKQAPTTSDGPGCSALSLADGQKCGSNATSADGLFCRFHARQCFGLYKGYKRRNAQLDALTASPPSYLTDSRKKLASQNFLDVEDEKVIDEIHHYLFNKYVLLDQVIKARKLHHKHFYTLTMDYGHEKYLNSLITEKRTASGALQRCYQRMAHLAFQRQKWFEWAKECQTEEDQHRENEQKKIKREAALFRRRAKELDRHLRERRAKEDARRQEEFLQRAYQQSMAERAEDDDDEGWDPISDVLENERDTYIALIKYCLWVNTDEDDAVAAGPSTQGDQSNGNANTLTENNALEPHTAMANEPSTSRSGKNGKKGKKGKGKNKQQSQGVVEDQTISTSVSGAQSSRQAQRAQPVLVPTNPDKERPDKEPDMTQIESRRKMQSRLIEGTKIEGGMLVSEGPNGKRVTSDRMPAIPAPEVSRLVDEVAEIKIFLLCRLLLRDVVLLAAAQKANSLDEFFKNPEVKTQELRDLCLKLEEPQLQDIRDACADFFRADDEDLSFETDEDSADSEGEIYEPSVKKGRHIKHPLPDIWQSKKEKQLKVAKAENAASREAIVESVKQSGEESGTRIDFGRIDDHGEFKKANLRVRICGRNIYNYPKKGSMSRRGWFHFSMIAKDCSIWKSIELCKSWDEFFELNILSLHLYFPSPQWGEWAGDMMRSQFLQFGFIPYYYLDDAEKLEIRRDLRSGGHRGHIEYQIRNFMCAQIKRNDPISRRFIQYVSMQTSRMFILVRDGKTGEIIVSPDEEELWLARLLIGLSRDPEDPNMQTLRSVGEEFFEEMDKLRSFHLGFADYYDVYIWSADPGVHWQLLHASILQMLHKAHRVCEPLDRWAIEAPVLKTLTIEKESRRVRDIRKDETVQSIWDEMSSEGTIFVWRNPDGGQTDEMPKSLIYTEADALEDAILFPDDADTSINSKRYRSVDNAVTRLESGRVQDLILAKFIGDLDTDEELPEKLKKMVQEHRTGRGNKQDSAVKGIEEKPHESEDTSSWEDTSESDQDAESETGPDPSNPDLSSEALAIRSRNESAWNYLSGGATALEAAQRVLNSMGEGPGRYIDMDAEFMVHIDLWKSKVFKECWHRCDFEAGAQQQWQEYLFIRSDAENDRALLFELALPCAQLLKYLNYHPETHLRVMKDARRAYSIISLFKSEHAPFFRTKRGSKHKNSNLFNQLQRSKHLPDRRGFQSCRFRDDSFYADLTKARKASRATQSPVDTLPLEWDICIRPKIAQLFSEGLICVSNVPPDYTAGCAFAGREGERAMDLFFDFRETLKDINLPHTMINPYTITIESLRQGARDFNSQSPKARFALLRLWSAPHFYPFMMGLNNRDLSTFVDAIGRSWAWKFMTKDMAYSEYSVHKNMCAKLEPLQWKLGKDSHQIKVRKDVVLVMGKDEEELLKLAAAATFTVQTQPWRLEIDFWKSFVNVDVEFLDALQDEWWA